jgi:glycosyltransferase involved in cell wall biosynthesis
MAALESMAVCTPILVQAETDPLKQHCLRGSSGLWFSNYSEFAGTVDLLLSDSRLRTVLGNNGLHYIQQNYSWEKIISKYEKMFDFLGSKKDQKQQKTS